MIKTNLVVLAIAALPISMVAQDLCADTLQTSRGAKAEVKKGVLHLEFRDGRLTTEAREVTLGTLLDAVTERTGVPFKVSDGTLRSKLMTISMQNLPLSEAIPLILVGYNTLHVWDEKMTLLEVQVLGRSVANAGPANGRVGSTARDATTAATAKLSPKENHPRTATPADPARIESALEELRSKDSPKDNSRRLAALNDLVGGDDARIAPALLDVALSGARAESATASENSGGGASKAQADSTDSQLAFKAALSLWRHGLERGFADKETISALGDLKARGDLATRDIATRALEDMQRNF